MAAVPASAGPAAPVPSRSVAAARWALCVREDQQQHPEHDDTTSTPNLTAETSICLHWSGEHQVVRPDVHAGQLEPHERGREGAQQAPGAQRADLEHRLVEQPVREPKPDRVDDLRVSIIRRGRRTSDRPTTTRVMTTGSVIRPRKELGKPSNDACQEFTTVPQLITALILQLRAAFGSSARRRASTDSSAPDNTPMFLLSGAAELAGLGVGGDVGGLARMGAVPVSGVVAGDRQPAAEQFQTGVGAADVDVAQQAAVAVPVVPGVGVSPACVTHSHSASPYSERDNRCRQGSGRSPLGRRRDVRGARAKPVRRRPL
jgi:hypothetical protein